MSGSSSLAEFSIKDMTTMSSTVNHHEAALRKTVNKQHCLQRKPFSTTTTNICPYMPDPFSYPAYETPPHYTYMFSSDKK